MRVTVGPTAAVCYLPFHSLQNPLETAVELEVIFPRTERVTYR